jgi:phosphoribosylformylglycinamidine cyclo-ligase
MYRVFNMGIGFVLAVRPKSVHAVAGRLTHAGEQAFVIGRIQRGHGRLELA